MRTDRQTDVLDPLAVFSVLSFFTHRILDANY
jgi:hypothetical protein